MNKKKVVAYIDASNLKFGIKQSGWEMNYVSFRSWLRDKFNVDHAILFMGMVSENKQYLSLLLKRTDVPIVILDNFIEKLKIKADDSYINSSARK